MVDATAQPASDRRLIWLIVSIALFVIVLLLPRPESLTGSGQAALALLVLAVSLWITECVSAAASAFVLMAAAIISMVGTSMPVAPGATVAPAAMSSGAVLRLMLAGFSESAAWLVAGALFLAAAMKSVGLDRRIALVIMNKVSLSPAGLIGGAIVIGGVLAMFIPSATARVGAVIPIMLGIIAALRLPVNSSLGAALIIVTAQACNVFNITFKTGAAQNLIGLSFIKRAFGQDITWGGWLAITAPFAVIMVIALFILVMVILRPEVPTGEGARAALRSDLDALGPVKAPEWRLIVIALLLLGFWSTEGVLHKIDSASVMLIGVAVLLAPAIGVMNWKTAEPLIPWGTIVMFGIGISLGLTLTSTGAAKWLADATLGQMGLDHLPVVVVIAALSAFNIILHLGFASATGLAASLIPIMIAFVQTLPASPQTMLGIVLIQQFVISFGLILPVNAPQNMLAYGTGAFTAQQFAKLGIPFTLFGYGVILLLSATVWKWMGVL